MRINKPWPKDPEEAPSADQIARAFVAAARETGDLERLKEAVQDLGPYRQLVTRSRWIALAALDMLYPQAGLNKLAQKLGYANAQDPWSGLEQARSRRWWDPKALNRVIEAI